jgi:RimJ/RimL family protein N-acetyltransferase
MDCWPLFDLVVRTPRLELRYVDDDDAAALMDLAATGGIHPPDFMPFTVPWTRFEPPHLQQQGMQHYWSSRAETSPQRWSIPFAIHLDGEVVGTQAVMANAFAVTRWVETGSWLGIPHQGKGIGKEMRAAALHLAFDALGAEFAGTGAFDDNPSSLGVTRTLGYRENGFGIADREGSPARMLRFVLARDDWARTRRDDITVEGLEPCLPLLGLAGNGAA